MTYTILKPVLNHINHYLATIDQKQLSPQYLSAVKELKNSIEKVLRFL